MRLLDTWTIKLREEEESHTVKYAILSHRWEEEEVTYQDMQGNQAPRLFGYQKIVSACEKAREMGYDRIWIDTCCIDKTSSVELSQAINSMFRYYQGAQTCIAFLSDWDATSKESLSESKWFKRGWTLQELLAPQRVSFYDKKWNYRGDRIKLCKEIHAITRIQTGVLNGSTPLADVPVAVRMSWASSRETKYIEDIAYCLLGIFDINMPLLYGEGSKAFLRLQEEIIKQSTDMSIFAWCSEVKKQKYTGLLASSPKQFESMHTLVVNPDASIHSREYNITNRGIRFHLSLAQDEKSGYFLLPINHGYVKGENLGVFLRQVGTNLFVRARPCEKLETLHGGDVANKKLTAADGSFHIKTLSLEQSDAIEKNVLSIQTPEEATLDYVEPVGSWSQSEKMLYAGHTGVFVGYMQYSSAWSDAFDTFVLVCHFAKNHWSYGLVPGDDWTEIKPHFYEMYRNGDNLFQQDTELVLPHLWKDRNVKVVKASFGDGRLRLAYLHRHD
jgi:hypothetical protein